MTTRGSSNEMSRRSFLQRLAYVAAIPWLWPGAPVAPGSAKAAATTGTTGPIDGAETTDAPSAMPVPVKVAATVSLAGPLAPFGEAVRRALLLWRDTANHRAGEALFELELRDDLGRPEIAARVYEELAHEAHVLVGPYGSRLTEVILPICRRHGVPVLVPSAGESDLDLTGSLASPPIGFSLLPPNDEALTGAVEWAASVGLQRIALLFRNDPFSRQVALGARRRAKDLGLHVVWDRTFSNAAEIWATSMELFGYGGGDSRHVNNHADILIGGGYVAGTAAAGFLPDAQEITIAFEGKVRHKALLVAPTFPEFAQVLGPRADGVMGNTNWKAWFDWPGNRTFAEAFRMRWNDEPDSHSAAAYAAGQLIERAVQRQRRNPSKEPDLDSVRGAFRRAFSELETTTVFGPYAVDAEGAQRAHFNTLLRIQDGAFAALWPSDAHAAHVLRSSNHLKVVRHLS